MRKRFPVAHSPARGYHVALPTYLMIDGSWLPITPTLIHRDGPLPAAAVAAVLALDPTVLVEIPNDYIDPLTGEIDVPRIRETYRRNPHYDRPDWTPPKPVV